MLNRFTNSAKEALAMAELSANELGHNYIGTEHLVLGLLSVKESVAYRALENQNLTKDFFENEILKLTGAGLHGIRFGLSKDFTPRTKRVIENSAAEATRMGTKYIGTEHILLSLLREQDSIAVRILASLNINGQNLYNDILDMLGEGNKKNTQNVAWKPQQQNAPQNRPRNNNTTPTLDKFSRDFTKMASENKFDPIIGREKEINRLIQILSRRTKNNPCLVGDPGVGKTAIAEGLAQKIISGDIPELLKGKRVVSLDLSSMVAGSKYRGEFEERIKKVLDEVIKSTNIILFIDEVHTIIGAGSAEGSIDAANILKPALSRGELQLIGTTTLDEYRKYIEKDAALERRFQPVTVEEPNVDDAVKMLHGLKDRYEAHHNVKITDKAIIAAVTLSARYITDRFLPDKAIDLMDEAASKTRLKIYTAPPIVKELEEQILKLDNEKESAIKTEAFEKAFVIKNKQEKLRSELEYEKAKWQKTNIKKAQIVDENEIAEVLADWTKIPVSKLQETESAKLKNLEKIIHQRVIGQNEAVSSVSKAIRRSRVGLKNPNKPIGSFLFLGPTGVGKTELSKALAEAMFGDESAIIRVDMSEYMEKHSVSKLIGSPPGYVGYDDGGHFSEKIRRKPYSVILFDEIEKAHPDIFNILLQVLDDGHVTDSQGRRVNFKNTIIIMTSNAGAGNIINPKRLGFSPKNDAEKDYSAMKSLVMEEVKKLFKPEFLNRVDDIIVFHQLTKKNIRDIAKNMLGESITRIKENLQIDINVTPNAISHIADKGYDPDYGARPLRRAIQTEIEDFFAEQYLAKKFKKGESIEIKVKSGNIDIEKT